MDRWLLFIPIRTRATIESCKVKYVSLGCMKGFNVHVSDHILYVKQFFYLCLNV